MIFLGLTLILLPLFIVVAIWTDIGKTMRGKVVITVISAISMYMVISGGLTSNKLDDSEALVATMNKVNREYYGCIIKSDAEDQFSKCVMDHIDILEKLYGEE